jgi:MtrB/PioB family decaheme-associated outer membrane protein
MKFHPRAHTVALLAGAVLAQGAAVEPVRADSGVGADAGNALNPAPINPTTSGWWMDEEGLGTRIPAARTPSGWLYNIPLDPGGEIEAIVSDDGWATSGSIELGGIRTYGDDRSQGFRVYKDLSGGPYVNNFAASSEKRDEARFAEIVGGGIGRNDQFYSLQFGRYNDWKVTTFYNETPQIFTASYRSLWNGVGSGNLTLSNLTPGGTTNAATTQANIQNALAVTGNSDLEILRKTAGVRYDTKLDDSWKFYSSFTNEKRKGSRPFGAVFGGGGGGGNVEIPESIDYDTRDFLAGIQFSDSGSSFNLRASASFFRNDIDTMTFENPLFITLNGSTGLSPTTFTRGRFDLAPNNEHYKIKGEYARALPDLYRGNVTATVALGSMRQNDNLIAPTEYPLTGGTVTAGGTSLADVWNTTAALSRQSAQARIDTRLADVGLSLKPAGGLDVKGKLRYYGTSNAMQYQSCNPLTGQWGRLLNDGSGLSLANGAYNSANCDLAAVQAMNIAPTAGNIPIRSVPYDYEQLNTSLAADYRIDRTSSVNAAIERESYRREFRERDRTWEDKIKLGYVDRTPIDGTIRLSYEHARRRGSEYNTNPYQPFLSASMGPAPTANGVNVSSWFHSIEQFRSFDLADRDQNIVNGRVNYALRPDLDGAVTVQFKDAEFPGQYGRTGRQQQNSITFDLSYQSGSTAVLYGFYTYQAGTMSQKGVQPNSCILGNTYYFYSNGQVLTAVTGAPPPATPPGTVLVATQDVTAGNWSGVCGAAGATSPLFPDSRIWEVNSKDRNDVVGAGVKYDFGLAKLDANFTRALGRTQIDYSYNPAALGMTATQAALAGNGLSDLTFAQSILNASLVIPYGKHVALNFLGRFESGKIRDWHYDGVAANPMPANNAVYLDAGPQDYRARMVGVLIRAMI